MDLSTALSNKNKMLVLTQNKAGEEKEVDQSVI